MVLFTWGMSMVVLVVLYWQRLTSSPITTMAYGSLNRKGRTFLLCNGCVEGMVFSLYNFGGEIVFVVEFGLAPATASTFNYVGRMRLRHGGANNMLPEGDRLGVV